MLLRLSMMRDNSHHVETVFMVVTIVMLLRLFMMRDNGHDVGTGHDEGQWS